MQIHRRSMLVAAVLLFSTPFVRAQNATDPSGHWEGAIHVPNSEISIQIDLAKKANGDPAGAFSGVNIAGFPLSDVVFEGTTVRFQLKVNDGGAFRGTLSADGRSIAGEFTAASGGYVMPFNLARTGDARLATPTNPEVGKELEGSWAGTLDVNGMPMRVTLKMTNQPDGTSIGFVANLDQGGVEIPITSITQKASSVTLDVTVVKGSFAGTLNAAGTELAGTWTQGALTAPLTFQRVPTVGK